MIRINLIQKKQPSYVNASRNADPAPGLGDKLKGFTSFKDKFSSQGLSAYVPILITIGIPIVIGFAVTYGYNYYIDLRVEEMNQESVKLEDEKGRINKELQKMKGFESVKAELERNELVLRTKIETIEKLIRGRDFTVKTLVTLAQSMPRDIWMTDITATETAFELKGGTVDLTLVTEFMTKLGQTIYYREVTLKNTAAEPTGKQGTFDLTARRE
ncbi:MAG: PilN domain-containing protein [Bdellovibrionales bacterium]|nr:PilN domain-containing protein [Oligoflexia bacterium]